MRALCNLQTLELRQILQQQPVLRTDACLPPSTHEITVPATKAPPLLPTERNAMQHSNELKLFSISFAHGSSSHQGFLSLRVRDWSNCSNLFAEFRRWALLGGIFGELWKDREVWRQKETGEARGVNGTLSNGGRGGRVHVRAGPTSIGFAPIPEPYPITESWPDE